MICAMGNTSYIKRFFLFQALETFYEHYKKIRKPLNIVLLQTKTNQIEETLLVAGREAWCGSTMIFFLRERERGRER